MFPGSFLFLVLSIYFINSFVSVIGDSPIVATAQGQIKGISKTSRNGKTYFQFLGIPFGKVPARFQNSIAADKWEGILDGTKHGSPCIQANTIFLNGKIVGSEDCLFLNVNTPKFVTQGDTQLLPVMVFIYGGGFTEGSADLYPDNYLTDHDVVTVTINYRMGVFGFLNAGVNGASGNQALKDQVLALKWVQENIEIFGGDANRTTIFGQSAGGASVNLLVLSPMAKGLFQNAISMSGVGTCPWANKNEPSIKEAEKLAASLDCPISNHDYMVQCLRRMDPSVILESSKLRYLFGWEFDAFPQFGPTIEKVEEGDNSTNVFLSEDPYTLAVEGKFNKVPYILGVVRHEGYLINAKNIVDNEIATKRLNDEWGRLAPVTFLYKESALDPCVVSGKVKDFYFQNRKIDNDTFEELTNLFSDRLFNQCVREMSMALAQHTDVYLYNFTKTGPNSLTDAIHNTNPAQDGKPPVHVDDLQYLFKMPLFYPEIKADDQRANFSNAFAKLFTSFAKNGKPTELWGSATSWKPIDCDSSQNPKWLVIDDEANFEDENPNFTARMEFWKNLPLKEYGRSAQRETKT